MKKTIKIIFRDTPFYPVHIGQYLRRIYFFRTLKKLPINLFQQVLDAGCGAGLNTLEFANSYPHLKIIGKDIKKFKKRRQSVANVRFEQQDLRKMTDKSRYDFCFSIDVLEHISGNRQVLENIYQSLKPGGYFYLHMPSLYQRRIFPKKFFKKQENWSRAEHIGERYSRDKIKTILKSIGFEIVETSYTFGFWGSLAWEVDRMTDDKRIAKVILMPLLKAFVYLDYWLPKFTGNGILVLNKKPNQRSNEPQR